MMYGRLTFRKVLLLLIVTTGIVSITFYLRAFTSDSEPSNQQSPDSLDQSPLRHRVDGNINAKPPVLEPPAENINGVSRSQDHVSALGRNAGCLAKKRHITLFKPLPPYNTYDHSDIVHYVKLSYQHGGAISFNFREYLAMLSAYKFYKPKTILVHTNGVLQGKYWDKMQQLDQTHTTIKPNKIKRPTTVGGRRVGWIQHSADYVKVTKVKEYGGIVSDMDVIIINGTRLRELQRISECVLSHEGTANIINAGFFSCAKGSTFIKKWVETYDKDYRPHLWVHNAAYAPSAVLLDKSNCYNVFSDGTVCQDPKWGNADWWLKPGRVNWESKIASHYWFNKILTMASVPSDESVLTRKIGLAEMFNYVVNA